MKGKNQERRERALWRFEGRIERESERRGAFFFCFYPYRSGVTVEIKYNLSNLLYSS